MSDYPVWMSLPLEYQDDTDILNYIRYRRGEPPYVSTEVIWIELTMEDFGGTEKCEELLKQLKRCEIDDKPRT